MKRPVVVMLLTMLIGMNLHSQKIPEFPKAWECKLTFEPKFKQYSPDGLYVFGANKEEMVMIDGSNGKILWQLKYKDAYQIKSFKFIGWNPESGVIVLSNEDEKKKNSEKLFVDDKTGAVLWKTDRIIHEFEAYNIILMLTDCYIDEIKAIPVYTKEAIEMVEVKSGKVLWSNPDYIPQKSAVKSSFGMPADEKLKEKELYSFRISIDPTSKNLTINHDRIANYVDYKTGAEIDFLSFYSVELLKKNKPKTTLFGGKRTFIDEKNDLFLEFSYDYLSVWSSTKKKCKISAYNITEKKKIWESEFETKISRTMITNEDMVDVFIEGEHLYVLSEGLVCINVIDGKVLWKIPFFRTEYKGSMGIPLGGVKISTEQTPYAAASPVLTDDAVYVVDTDDKVDRLLRYDRKTGQKVWESEKFKLGDYIPDLFFVGDRVIVGFGGQAYVEKITRNLSTDEYKLELLIKYKGKNGIRAYDAHSGKLIWDAITLKDIIKDKFSGVKTNILHDEKNIYVCSDQNLLALDIQTGKLIYSTPIKDLKLKKPFKIEFDNNQSRIFVHFNKGIAAFNKDNGRKIYAVNTGKFISGFYEGNNYFIWVGKEYLKENELVGFDLDMGLIKGRYKFKTEFSFWETFKTGHITRKFKKEWFTADGNYLISFDGKNVVKYRINK